MTKSTAQFYALFYAFYLICCFQIHVNGSSEEDSCELVKSACDCFQFISSELICTRFDTFSDLNSLPFDELDHEFDSVSLEPKSKSHMNNATLALLPIKMNRDARVRLSNVLSFDVTTNPFRNAKPTPDDRFGVLTIYNSEVNLTYDGLACDSSLSNNSFLFVDFSDLQFDHCTFPLALCPWLFHGKSYGNFYQSNISNTNYLRFSQSTDNDDDLSQLSVNISSFAIFNDPFETGTGTGKLRLSPQMVDVNVFRSIEYFWIQADLIEIEESMFANNAYANLKQISILLTNFDDEHEFFRGPGNTDWMRHLSGSADRQLEIDISLNGFADTVYQFPDEDFCLCKDFPHDNNVFVQINWTNLLNCTCTIVWLLKNWSAFTDFNWWHVSSVVDGCVQPVEALEANIAECGFEERLKECDDSMTTDMPSTTTASLTDPATDLSSTFVVESTITIEMTNSFQPTTTTATDEMTTAKTATTTTSELSNSTSWSNTSTTDELSSSTRIDIEVTSRDFSTTTTAVTNTSLISEFYSTKTSSDTSTTTTVTSTSRGEEPITTTVASSTTTTTTAMTTTTVLTSETAVVTRMSISSTTVASFSQETPSPSSSWFDLTLFLAIFLPSFVLAVSSLAFLIYHCVVVRKLLQTRRVEP